jgi:hypothetical protein
MKDTLEGEAISRARKVGIRADLMKAALREQRRGRKFVVEFEDVPEGSFYRPAIEGDTNMLYINIDHPFFLDVYMGERVEDADPDEEYTEAELHEAAMHRAKIELMLWAMATGEIEATGDNVKRYVQERVQWSRMLRASLLELRKVMGDD